MKIILVPLCSSQISLARALSAGQSDLIVIVDSNLMKQENDFNMPYPIYLPNQEDRFSLYDSFKNYPLERSLNNPRFAGKTLSQKIGLPPDHYGRILASAKHKKR